MDIKFRAWGIHEKRMLKVYRLSFDGPIEGTQVHCYLDDRGSKGSKEYSYDGDGLILEQYTGLKDANGKDVYEGDLLKIKYPFSDNDEIGEVKWSNSDAGFIIGNLQFWKVVPKSVVVGNVHEDKDLLGADK